jgi:D-beta-D-heptose 7-phosphate kinase/D-beta-D-heptose 1-phosphate adenosyltransferase
VNPIEPFEQIFAEVEHGWSNRRLLVAGDVMLDKYVWGEVSRISPEAPVPVVRTSSQSERPGGAANVAMNLAGLGAQVELVGFAGGDENQALLEARLKEAGVAPQLVVSEGFPTITKLRIVGGKQQLLRLDSERTGERAASDVAQLLEAVRAGVERADAVVLSDYAKGALTPEICQAAIKAARKRGIPVLVDPKGADFSRYQGATTICPNLGELAAAARMDRTDLDALFSAAEQMVDEFGLDYLITTMSDKGIAVVRKGRRMIAPAAARQVFDVSGAGDTVIAVLALGLSSGIPVESAVALANLAAGVVVGKVGTVPVARHELLAALTSELALHADDKVVDRAELAQRVASWRANGERVVFTNGCFDLLHVGHITLLEQARRTGDRLIVAINSDASVRELKGPTRPVVGERDRARVLAALAAVDAVVIFGEPTPLEMILAVQPDVLVKGGDYVEETIVGAKEVRQWGGDVRIVPTVEGYSTTRVIERGGGKGLPE